MQMLNCDQQLRHVEAANILIVVPVESVVHVGPQAATLRQLHNAKQAVGRLECVHHVAEEGPSSNALHYRALAPLVVDGVAIAQNHNLGDGL